MLETARCSLSRLQPTDYENVRLLYMNEDVRKHLGGVIEEKEIKIRFEKMLQSINNACHFTVKEKKTDNFVGVISLDTYYDGISTELSYQFPPVYWGKGYATEACKAVIDFAFNELHIEILVGETQTANVASCRVLEKLGAVLREKVIRHSAEQAVYAFIHDEKNRKGDES